MKSGKGVLVDKILFERSVSMLWTVLVLLLLLRVNAVLQKLVKVANVTVGVRVCS